MPRILADIPDKDVEWLDREARAQGTSRAALLREAVSAFKAEKAGERGTNWLDQAFGVWKDRDDIGDAVEWQRRERAASTRPWDDDYEELKAEFPDLFDKDDDRQRQQYLEMIASEESREGKKGK